MIQVYGWKTGDMQDRYDELWPSGWRLHLLSPHLSPHGLRYAAAWRRVDPALGSFECGASTAP